MRLVRENAQRDELLEPFEAYLRDRGAELFEPGTPLTVGRGPARVDCMGGIADYSGSVVFEGPLRHAAVVAFQPRDDTLLRARSATFQAEGRPCDVQVDLADLRDGGRLKPYGELRTLLTADAQSAWAAYVLGVLPVLEREEGVRFERGGTFLLWSDIPIGVGVASSAAVEVAAMHAVASACALEMPGPRFAALAQVVENKVVGAPCGIMDQVTSALGEEGRLLALRCQPPADDPEQPCELLGHHELPEGVKVFGLSSRVEHSVAGSAYATARVSAFMGLKIILTARQQAGAEPTGCSRHLCTLSPEQYVAGLRALLPERMTGAEFIETYGETTDTVTSVDPNATYRVRAGADHPVFENARVQAFIECMDRAHAGDRTALVEAGGLMYASHWSYGWNCGLGCPQTDLLVRLVRRRGPEQGLYGAKITGGGSGGTVAILADARADRIVREIAADYESETGRAPDVFDGSSPGAYAFGARRYRFE